MVNTFYLTVNEVNQALVDYVYKKSEIDLPAQLTFVGFLDNNEQLVEVDKVQLFYEIE